MRLDRERLAQAAETMPLDSIFGKGANKSLTGKQKRFAREVAQGATKADAYRKAYKPSATRATLTGEPYRVATHPRVAAEIQALQLAEMAQSLQTPAQLRALVIQTLVQTAIDPDTKPAVRVQAAKVLGTVTEVAAFTEQKVVKHISSSEDARAKVMQEIRALMLGTEDAEDIQARELLEELQATADTVGGYDDAQPVDFIGDDTSDTAENEGKDGILSTNDPQIEGGVCDPLGGGQPDLGVGALDSYDILSHSNDSIPPPK